MASNVIDLFSGKTVRVTQKRLKAQVNVDGCTGPELAIDNRGDDGCEEDVGERMDRIRASISRVYQLMEELRTMGQVTAQKEHSKI
jgi:hypothetical protein